MKKSLILILLIFSFKPCFSEVLLWVDINPVSVGEIFNMHIQANNVDDLDEPEIKLIKGFEIVNRSKQNQTSIIGSKINRTVKWTYLMLAKYPGNYEIPSFKLGNKYTKPFLIQVVESKKNKQNDDVILEVNVSPKKVYLQQQILMRISIIRNGLQLVNESITPLKIEGVKLEKIKEESFQEVKNGKKQLITELLFVAIPEKSGLLNIPQINYQGDEINGVNLGGIFQKFGSYSQNKGRRIFSKSQSKSIEVMEIPDNIKGWWLPVNNLKLEEKLENENLKYVVGEPFTRTIYISVEGAYADQIPELKIKYPKKIKKYSDQPILKTDKTTNGLKGLRIEKFAFIPNDTGKVELPEISVEWWDVSNKQIKKSVIPSKIIDVVPNDSIVNYGTDKKLNSYEKNKKNKEHLNSLKFSEINNNLIFWQIITILLALLWSGTIVVLFFKKIIKIKSKVEHENNNNKRIDSINKATKKLKIAINIGSPNKLKKELLNWSKIYWKNDPPKGIEQIGDRLPEIKKGIKLLNSILYGSTKNKNVIIDLQNEFSEINTIFPKYKKTKKTYLKRIYPQTK